MKKLLLVCVFAIVVMACSTSPRDPGFGHRIKIPRKYQWGGSDLSLVGISPIKRYINSYEKGWWQCVLKFRADIDYTINEEDLQYIGSSIHIDGASTGFKDSYKQMNRMILMLGKEEVKKRLLSVNGVD